jgi:hypothetical protein
MIRDSDQKNLVVTVITVFGKIYSKCNIPSNPMGNHERVISFWDADRLMVFPLENVEYFYFSEQEPKQPTE